VFNAEKSKTSNQKRKLTMAFKTEKKALRPFSVCFTDGVTSLWQNLLISGTSSRNEDKENCSTASSLISSLCSVSLNLHTQSL